MRELSLFTGAGGGILGTKLLGWTPVGYVEWDDYCQRVLRQRQEDGLIETAPIFSDIRAFISEGYARRYRGMVDVITAGFPCQPFSVAGKQAGEDDPRNMWPATIECIRMVRPRYAFMENVPGLLNSGYFGRILGDLAESGYDVRWRVLSAAEVGAPHKRSRLWIMAYSRCGNKGERCITNEMHPERDSKKRTAGKIGRSSDNGGESNVADTDKGRLNPSRQGLEQTDSHQRGGTRNAPGQINLCHKIHKEERNQGHIGQLNPTWVELLMGWPRNWTLLDPMCHNELRQWQRGFTDGIKDMSELQEGVYKTEAQERETGGQGDISKKKVLFSILCKYQSNTDEARVQLEGEKAHKAEVRSLRICENASCPSYRPGHDKQCGEEHSDTMQALPQLLAHYGKEAWQDGSWENATPRVANNVASRVDRLKAIGNGQVPRVVAKAWELLSKQ